MYESELLDRNIRSLANTEEAFIDTNNRIINSVNQRKDRLNAINSRITNLSSKILALYQVNAAMRIGSGSHYP